MSDTFQPSGCYSNQEILAAIAAGRIVCHPFNKKHVAGASLDVTLGRWYYKTEYNLPSNLYNPFSQKDVESYFAGPFEATEHRKWVEQTGRQLLEGIPAEHPIIVLKPGERILAHTHEFVGIKPPGVTDMKARSTWGRNGIAVCIDAGWGDPGYINRWTMEVYNLNQHHSVVLPVGERIAQIIFHHTGPVSGEYSKLSGKYQQATDLEELLKIWKPEMMLPKAYKDNRQMSLEV